MTIDDVAKKLHVSIATVSRALNPSTASLVAKKTRERIRRFVDEVGYRPHRSARELSTGKTQTIGLVLPNILESIFFNDYLVKLLAGAYRVLERDGNYSCEIVILPKGDVLARIDQQIFASGIDGLLLSPYCDPALYALHFSKQLLNKWKKPVVFLNLHAQGMRHFSYVYMDHFEAARQAVTYLIQKGHRRIAMVKGLDLFPEIRVRYDGYKHALKEHGVLLRSSYLTQGALTIESGYAAVLGLLQTNKKKRPTAIFCANDEMAIGALRALRVLGVRCPQDVAVMGYDGLDLGEYVVPRLTTLLQPTAQVAETATSLLIDLIEKRETSPINRKIAGSLLIRDSA